MHNKTLFYFTNDAKRSFAVHAVVVCAATDVARAFIFTAAGVYFVRKHAPERLYPLLHCVDPLVHCVTNAKPSVLRKGRLNAKSSVLRKGKVD